MNPTDPNSPRYTDDTVDLVAREIKYFLVQEAALQRKWDFAMHLLDALADAGLLLKPGERAVHTATADEEAKDQW